MADWKDQAMDNLLQATDKQFAPLPNRKLHGRMYENVPLDSFDPKKGEYSVLHNPENDEGPEEAFPNGDPNRLFHTYELDEQGNVIKDPRMRQWRLMQEFHGS